MPLNTPREPPTYLELASRSMAAEAVSWNQGVFRYLDTSHDGDISRREFETLERVWRELQQSMYESLDFSQLCCFLTACLPEMQG